MLGFSLEASEFLFGQRRSGRHQLTCALTGRIGHQVRAWFNGPWHLGPRAWSAAVLCLGDGEPVEVLIDDILFRRRGKRVWAASWFHDGSAPGPAKTGYGNNWAVLAVRVSLPMISRPVAIRVMAKLVIKDSTSGSRLWLARRMVTRLAAELPGRRVHVTADSAYASEELKELPGSVTWTTRLRSNAALYGLAPERTGRKGRPRKKATACPPSRRSPPRRSSRKPPSPATARLRPFTRMPSPACGTTSPARQAPPRHHRRQI